MTKTKQPSLREVKTRLLARMMTATRLTPAEVELIQTKIKKAPNLKTLVTFCVRYYPEIFTKGVFLH